MRQQPLLPELQLNKPIVNIASVPHRSLFRYPGGKTWLIPLIRQWFASMNPSASHLIEAFAGGATVGLTSAFEQLVEHVTLVELDEQVASVWQTIIEGNSGEWLANQITSFIFTEENVEAILNQTNLILREQAFQTIIKNRVMRGGILAPGAGRIKHGEAGKGLGSRWYPETLKKRTLEIVAIRDRISFVYGDGLEIIQQHKDNPSIVFFLDPPYTAAGKRAGKRLYTHFDIDHEELFRIASSLSGNFLMTYDDNEFIHNLAQNYGFETRLVPMKNTHHAKMTELLISRDMSWMT